MGRDVIRINFAPGIDKSGSEIHSLFRCTRACVGRGVRTEHPEPRTPLPAIRRHAEDEPAAWRLENVRTRSGCNARILSIFADVKALTRGFLRRAHHVVGDADDAGLLIEYRSRNDLPSRD